MFVAEVPEAAQALGRHGTEATLALHRLDKDRSGLRPNGRFQRLVIAERHLIEAVDLGAEPFNIFLLTARCDGCERAAMKGPLESEDAVALRLAIGGMEFPRGLDRAFIRLGTGIREEYDIREGRLGQPAGEAFTLGDHVEIGDMPELLRLRGQRLHEMGMRMPDDVHGDAAGKVEESSPVGCVEPRPLTSLEGKIRACICRKDGRSRCLTCGWNGRAVRRESACARHVSSLHRLVGLRAGRKK